MKFKDRLVTTRKSRAMTQQQMAELMGISLTAYKKYESGSGQPTMENLLKIAETLEISIDDLCGRWETKENEALLMRMQKIEKLDEEEKKVINTILESMMIRHATKSVLEGNKTEINK